MSKAIYFFVLVFSNLTEAYTFKSFELININSQHLKIAQDIDLKNSNIYDEVENTLSENYLSIGEKLRNNSLLSHNYAGDVKNYNGFTWQKPFLNFNMNIKREIAPHLFSKKFVLRDTLILEIDAKTFLSNLKSKKLIKIDPDTLASFAGIKFTRTFESSSLVKDYREGMQKGLNNLFFAFKNLTAKKVLNLSLDDNIKRIDTLSAQAGAIGLIPLTTGLNLNLAALGKYSFINMISVHNQEEDIIIQHQKENILRADFSADLQLDFFNLLKISLLSYELSYELTNSEKNKYKINSYEKESFLRDSNLQNDLNSLLKENYNTQYLKDYIVLKESRSKEDLSSNFEIFLYGKNKSKATEEFEILNNGNKKTFYSHTNSSSITIQTFFSKIFSNLLGLKATTTEITKKFSLNYEKQFEDHQVKSSADFSFEIEHSLYAQSLKKKVNINRALSFLNYWSGFPDEIKELIKNKKVTSNLKISSKLNFKKDGIDYFLLQTKESVKNTIKGFCENKSKERACNNSLEGAYDELYKENQIKTTINMNTFRKLLSLIYNYSYRVEDFHNFFKIEHIHIYSKLTALTNENIPFVNYYTSGQLEDSNVISKFSRI